MIKIINNLISKLLVLVVCTSLVPTTIAFAEEDNIQETATNVVQTTGAAVSVVQTTSATVSVIAASDFVFNAQTGTIKRYWGSDSEVVIPSEINGVSVTSIGDYAFSGCSSLTSITVPDSITSIGDYAFYGCSSLTSITVPDSITSIGNYAFYGCSSLTSITVPDSITSIGNYAFYDCSSLTSITIPDSVTSIGWFAFSGCEKTIFYVESEKIKQLLINVDVDESKIILNGQTSTVSMTSITLTNTSLRLEKGNTSTLTATVLPSNAINKAVTWTTNDSTVATIDANGKVTGVGAGSATITCTAKDGSGKSATCLVTVTEELTVNLTSVTLNNTSLSLQKGNTSTLTSTVLPSNASNKAVTWTTSDSTVATIDANGKVTGIGAGSATITCTAKDGSGKSATCLVTVTNKSTVTVSGIKLSIKYGNGTEFTLIPTVSPSNATNKEVTWSSSNTNVATVDENGKVTYVGIGSATITCIAKDGSGKSAKMFVKMT